MVYKSKMAQERNVGDNMKIKDLLAGKNIPMDFVIGELDGFHGDNIHGKSAF